MPDRVIDNPIINSPYREPQQHFKFDTEGITNEIVENRRPSSYFVPVPRPRKRGTQQQLEFAELTGDQIEPNQLVNDIRARVGRWREAGYPDVTPVSRRLLEYWSDPARGPRLHRDAGACRIKHTSAMRCCSLPRTG